MRTTRNLVGVLVELTACVQDGHDHLCRATPFFLVNIYWDTTAVVGNGDAVVAVDDHVDLRTMTGERLVDRVVYNLEDHVVQAGSIVGITDIHARTFANGIQAF